MNSQVNEAELDKTAYCHNEQSGERSRIRTDLGKCDETQGNTSAFGKHCLPRVQEQRQKKKKEAKNRTAKKELM